jgi:hypothetical protein
MQQASQTDADVGDAHDIKETIRSMAGAVKEQTRQAVDDIKEKGANKVSGITSAVHGAADELGQQVPQFAAYMHATADRIDFAARAWRDRSVEEMATSFAAFARRQPTAAFAVSALAGFALTRFLKSSASSN